MAKLNVKAIDDRYLIGHHKGPGMRSLYKVGVDSTKVGPWIPLEEAAREMPEYLVGISRKGPWTLLELFQFNPATHLFVAYSSEYEQPEEDLYEERIGVAGAYIVMDPISKAPISAGLRPITNIPRQRTYMLGGLGTDLGAIKDDLDWIVEVLGLHVEDGCENMRKGFERLWAQQVAAYDTIMQQAQEQGKDPQSFYRAHLYNEFCDKIKL